MNSAKRGAHLMEDPDSFTLPLISYRPDIDRALDLAIAEINEKTDLNIERAKYRRVTGLVFAIKTQSDIEGSRVRCVKPKSVPPRLPDFVESMKGKAGHLNAVQRSLRNFLQAAKNARANLRRATANYLLVAREVSVIEDHRPASGLFASGGRNAERGMIALRVQDPTAGKRRHP
jgi:hypothetical protein